jgi:anti-sigma regulatory factor (Ser/Thr protein kinase)
MAIEAQQPMVGAGEHIVQFYERDLELIEVVGGYLAAALHAGEVALIIATPAHGRALEAELTAAGIDLEEARHGKALVTLDAAQTMSRFVVDGRADPARFETVIGGLVGQALESGRAVRAFGEMVALLWDTGQVAAAIELEDLWNALGRVLPLSLWCGYPTHAVSSPEHADALREVCHLHSAVFAPHAAGEHLFLEADTLDLGTDRRREARRFEGNVGAPGSARRFVVETLQGWGRHELVDDAGVVVTELATNAVLHTRRPFMVEVSALVGAVLILVHDTSPVPPVQRPFEPMNQSGRGLSVVATLADRWGAELRPDGKAVWAELRL